MLRRLLIGVIFGLVVQGCNSSVPSAVSDSTSQADRLSADVIRNAERAADEAMPADITGTIAPALTQSQSSAGVGSSTVVASCDVPPQKRQEIFEEFVALEDIAGMAGRERTEQAIANSYGISVLCVQRTIISALEAGLIPPAP